MNKIIKTAKEHATAVNRLTALMDADPAVGSVAAEELELLAHLIEQYEKKRHDIGLPDPLTAIAFRMEQQGLSRKDMALYFGSQSRVSEVLNGKRALSVAMIRRLHRQLGIPAESLLGNPGPEEVPVAVPQSAPGGMGHAQERTHETDPPQRARGCLDSRTRIRPCRAGGRAPGNHAPE